MLIENAMSLPYRVSLPYPLPENVVPFPGSLDNLVLELGQKGVPVAVVSQATGAKATLDEVLSHGGLDLADTGEPVLISVTHEEIAGLRPFAVPVAKWADAFASGDREGMIAAIPDIRAVPTPPWLDVVIAMPLRSARARLA